MELYQWVLAALLAAALVAATYYVATHRGAQAAVVSAGASLLADLKPALRSYLTAHPLTRADLDGWLDNFGATLTDPRLRAGYAALRPQARELALEYLAALMQEPPTPSPYILPGSPGAPGGPPLEGVDNVGTV